MKGGVLKLGFGVALSGENEMGHTSVCNTPPQLGMPLVYYYMKGGIISIATWIAFNGINTFLVPRDAICMSYLKMLR